MHRPDRNPANAEDPATSAQETPGPASVDSDPNTDDGSAGEGEGGPVPEPATDAEHGRGAAQDGDAYRPL